MKMHGLLSDERISGISISNASLELGEHILFKLQRVKYLNQDNFKIRRRVL